MITIDSLEKLRSNENFRGFEGINGPTPVQLCQNMIDLTPVDYKDPNKKWLFPAAGHGTYAIIVYWKYMKGLSEIFIDNNERSRHILNNMLYLNEINPWLCRQLCNQGFINVIEGDYVNYDFKMKFDAVVGNSPYQSNSSKDNSANALWVKFGEKSKELLKEDGYFALVHPDSWINYSDNYENSSKGRMTTRLYRSRVLSKIKPLFIWLGNEIKETYFPKIGVDFSVIIGKKTNENLNITIKHDGNIIKVDSLGKNLIPKSSDKNVINLFNKLFNNNNNFFKLLQNEDSGFVSDRRKWINISETKTDLHIYPLCNTSSQYNNKVYLWSSIPHVHQNTSKVIFSDSGYSRPFYDKGEFGLSSHSFGIECDEHESDKLIFYLNSKTLEKILSYTASSGAESKLSVIKKMIPKIYLKNIIVGDEYSILESLQTMYKLNNDEICLLK